MAGLLLSYCHSFDILVGTPFKIYWVITNIAYTLGIVATFVSLYLMKAAQPALLFLVPFTLIPVFIASLIRGDLGAMWRGDFPENSPSTSKENINTTNNTGVPIESDVSSPRENVSTDRKVLPANENNTTASQYGATCDLNESRNPNENGINISSR